MDKALRAATQKYANYMREIKCRTDVIMRVLSEFDKGGSLTGYRESDAELCFLQIRKILELVMFASLVAHHESGVALQKELVESEWNAARILAFLSKANPFYFPQALKRVINPSTGVAEMHSVEGALTSDEFRSLYSQVCGSYLHASRRQSAAEDHAKLFSQVRQYINKIIRLLNSHWAIVAHPWAFAVLMKTDVDGDVQVMLFKNAGGPLLGTPG